jgi:uncharacterized SAM-binding protein YcdF (DUF218 family)
VVTRVFTDESRTRLSLHVSISGNHTGVGSPERLPRSNNRMLFFLRKFIEALLLPIGFSGLLVIAGVVLRRRWIAVAGVIILYSFSTQFAGRRMMRPLERIYRPETVTAAPNADGIVVLSGGIVRGVNVAGVQWGESANRYYAGIDLAMAGKAKVLIISAGLISGQGAILRQTAIQGGIQPERVILTPPVSTTEDEARAVSEIPGIHSILLVTSAFHMPRAVLLFRARGLSVSPFPTDQRAMGRGHLSKSEFIPVSGPLRESEAAMREYYGLALYRMILPFRHY